MTTPSIPAVKPALTSAPVVQTAVSSKLASLKSKVGGFFGKIFSKSSAPASTDIKPLKNKPLVIAKTLNTTVSKEEAPKVSMSKLVIREDYKPSSKKGNSWAMVGMAVQFVATCIFAVAIRRFA